MFTYLLRLLRVIDKPFEVGRERTDDDVSLFLLVEFVVHAHGADEGVAAEDVAGQAAEVEEYLTDIEAPAAELAEAENNRGSPTSGQAGAQRLPEDGVTVSCSGRGCWTRPSAPARP